MDTENNNLNIVLIGMMGSGKTYIGNRLAKLLVHFNYIDTDEKIENNEKLSIPEIFEKYGEAHFRDIESDIIKNISEKRNQIISLGGGAFENSNNINELRKNGLIFYLKATSTELFNRISNDNGEQNRPKLKDDFSVKTITNLLKKREKNYLKADFVIDTNQKHGYTILNDILKEYDAYVKQKTSC